MEEIIGLLVALAAIIFKVVENRLKSSGTDAPAQERPDAGQMWREFTEIFGDGKPEEAFPPVAPMPEVEESPVETAQIQVNTQTYVEAPRAVVMTAAAPDKASNKENIDLKKLVVYSEIMKPKFKEEN